MNIKRIDHFVLTVRDMEATIHFYTTVLGMRLITFGEGRKALGFGNQKINLHPYQGQANPSLVAETPTPGSADFCLITETPLTQVIAELKAHNVPILMGPMTRSGAIGPIQSVYFRDPDNNLVEVSNYGDYTETA